MPNYRCQYYVIDPQTKKTRLCKNNKKNGWNYCLMHLNIMYSKQVIIIQSKYRSYYIRKKSVSKIQSNYRSYHIRKINIIKIQKNYRAYKIRNKLYFYKNLPEELQYIIYKNIRYDHKIVRENKIISNIIINKIDNFIINYYNFNHQIDVLKRYIEFTHIYSLMINEIQSYWEQDHETIIKTLLNLFHLLDKYKSIIIVNKQLYIKKYRDDLLRTNMIKKLFDLNILLLKNKKNLIRFETTNTCYMANLINFKYFYKFVID